MENTLQKKSKLADFSPIDFKEELNEEQYAAVTAEPGPALVLAGAGSGKTRTLTYRVAWLISQGVSPGEILLLTFTNKASKEMLKRVEDLTGIETRFFWGGTFHHIGQKTIRFHGESIGLQKNYVIHDQGDSEALLSDVVKSINSKFFKDKANPKARLIHEIISYARNTRQTIRDVINIRYYWLDNLKEDITQFAKSYQEEKLKRQVTDYDDLLHHWLEILKTNSEVATYYQNRFKHILVDEYQDTNKIQSDIIDFLGINNQVMAVGDDAQCIYTWRGASFENIMTFSDRHPKTVMHKIETNYRSTPEILQFANRVLATQPIGTGFNKELKSIRPSGSLPYVVPVMDGRKQAEFVIKRVEGLINEGYRMSDIAILYRAHYHALDMQVELSRLSIPFVITSGVKFFEQAHVRDLVAHLRFAANIKDITVFKRLVCLLPKIGDVTAGRLYSLAEKFGDKNNKTIIQSLSNESVVAKVPAEAKEDWIDLSYTLQDLELAINGPSKPKKELSLFDDDTAEEKVTKIHTPDEVVKIAIDGWYGDYMRNVYVNWESRRDDLDSIVGFASGFEDMNELLAQLILLNSESSDRGANQNADAIRMTTIHQAKGLEYPIVFIIGMAEGLFPLKRSIDNDDVEEERRLFYVAVTRAKDELYICYPMINTQNGPSIRMGPSQFLEILPDDSYEILNVRQTTNW